MMRQIGAYSVADDAPGVLRFEDGKGSSFYLMEGDSAAILVDTGMADEPLRPVIEKLTDQPVIVCVTHGHGDHMRHADAFDDVRISPKDIPLIHTAFSRLGITSALDVSRLTGLNDGDVVRAGNLTLRVLDVGGHSPGSLAFYTPERNILFTGDAVGSGAGVWMQLAGCLPLSMYRANLRRLLSFLDALPVQPHICPGHAGQRYMHKGTDNPVCRELVSDMITLCTLILEHRDARVDAPAQIVREMKPAYVSEYGRASIVYSDAVIA